MQLNFKIDVQSNYSLMKCGGYFLILMKRKTQLYSDPNDYKLLRLYVLITRFY